MSFPSSFDATMPETKFEWPSPSRPVDSPVDAENEKTRPSAAPPKNVPGPDVAVAVIDFWVACSCDFNGSHEKKYGKPHTVDPRWLISHSRIKDIQIARYGKRDDVFFSAPDVPNLLMADARA